MSDIKMLAGDFKKNGARIDKRFFSDEYYFTLGVPGKFLPEEISLNEVAEIDVINSESDKKMLGAIGWGIVGGVALGGLGLLAGVLAGGNGNDVTFKCVFKDGRKFIGVTRQKSYNEIAAKFF